MSIPWSYSRVTRGEECWKKLYLVNIAKKVKEEQSIAAQQGQALHDGFEKYLKYGVPNQHIWDHQKLLDTLRNNKPKCSVFETEYTIVLNDQWDRLDPKAWFGKEAWLRLKIDLALVSRSGTHSLLYDWKTNNKIKKKDNEDQGSLYAAIMFLIHPEIESIQTLFYYTKMKETVKFNFSRDDADALLNDWMQRYQVLEDNSETDIWPASPSLYTCKWCPAKLICPDKYKG